MLIVFTQSITCRLCLVLHLSSFYSIFVTDALRDGDNNIIWWCEKQRDSMFVFVGLGVSVGFEDKSGSFNLLENSFLHLVFRFFWCFFFFFGLREN